MQVKSMLKKGVVKGAFCFWLALLLLITLFVPVYSGEIGSRAGDSTYALGNEIPLTLIYTSNTLGEVGPRETCPEAGNNGGLARRSFYIDTVRKKDKNLLVLDGGDALVLSFFDRESEKEKARKRAGVVLKIYEKIGYDALNIGDTDLGLGIEYLRNLQKSSKIPFLSANFKSKRREKPFLTPTLLRRLVS